MTLKLPSSGGKARSGGGGAEGVVEPKTVQAVMDISWYSTLKQQKLFTQQKYNVVILALASSRRAV